MLDKKPFNFEILFGQVKKRGLKRTLWGSNRVFCFSYSNKVFTTPGRKLQKTVKPDTRSPIIQTQKVRWLAHICGNTSSFQHSARICKSNELLPFDYINVFRISCLVVGRRYIFDIW